MPADPMQTHVSKTLAHTSPLVSCRYDRTGRFVFAGDQDNKVVRWEVATDKKVELVGHESWVRAIAFSPNGQSMITGGHEGKLIWWSPNEDQPVPLRTVQAHHGWIRALAISPDGRWLASCGNDLKVKLWNLDDGAPIREFTGHERHVYNVCFHPDNKQLLSGDLTAKFMHWDIETGNQVRNFELANLSKYDPGFQAHYGGPYCLEFSPDGKRFFAGGITNVTNAFAGVGTPIVVQVDWETAKEVASHQSKAGIQGTAWGIHLHPDGYLIGTTGGQGGGNLFFWKYDSKDEFHTLKLGPTSRDLSVHPDGIQLATAHFDKNLRVSLMSPKPA